MAKINSVHPVLRLLFTVLIVSLIDMASAHAANQFTSFGSGTAIIGDEVDGLAGPSPINCTALAYVNARAELDAQRSAWIATATGEIVGGIALGSSIVGPSGTPINAPLLLAQSDGFLITATPVDLAATYGFNTGSNAPGTPAFANVQINGSPNGCTMQDNAPKPSSPTAGDFYFNQLNNLNGLNAVRFTFSTPIQAFGAFWGDLETSSRGVTAFMRLLDANGALISDVPIPSTLSLAGGVAAENAQCSQTNVPGADVASQGLLPGCGNAATRWVGFVSSIPVAQALVVVGDNDLWPGGRGRSEKLSFMGPTVVRTLPAADVALSKQAPVTVTVGVPFNYTIVVSNPGATLAAGVVISDVAPAGITFNAVTGENCSLVGDRVTCHVGTLAAGASTTILVRATATGTATVTNTALVAASNDSNFNNNTASVTVTPLPAPPINACASPAVSVGAGLIINEIMYRQAANGDEWVELYAATDLSSGTQFFVSDNEPGNTEYRFLLTIPAAGIAAGTYLVIHSAAGTDDTSLLDGDGLEYFGAGGGLPPYLNNTGDNITLYAGTSTAGTPLDYVAYGSGAAIDGPATGWSLPQAPIVASAGQSIAAVRSGSDSSNGAQWAVAGSVGTLGPATPGLNNNGKIICNVAIDKRGPSTGMVGAPFDYVITVSNTTGVTLTGVVVTDTQPVGLIFNRVTGAGCNLAGGNVTCVLGLLLPHASQVITVNAVASHAGVITNTAYTNAISDTIALDNTDPHPMPFLPPGAIGDFVYLDLNANGTQDASETIPINNVPITLTYADGRAVSTLTVDGFYLFPNLPAGVYTVTVGSVPGYLLTSAPSVVVNLAESQVYTTADFGFIYAVVNLEITKHGVDHLLLGHTFLYTLVATNRSAAVPALDVVLTDTQPTGITFTAVSDPRCTLFAGDVTCNLGNLPPLAGETVVITATAVQAGVWVNTASMTATNQNAAVDNRASFTTTVSPLPWFDLALIKQLATAQSATVQPGEDVTFTLTVQNQGQITATQIAVIDYLPLGFGLHDSDWTAGPNHTAIYTLTVDLAPGAQAAVDITLLAETTLATDTSNVAEISRADNDNDPNNAPPVDIDSTPDATADNDGTTKDDVTTEDGKHSPTDDEDDHDLAHVTIQPVVAVGNYVWIDANGDGQQQQGEPPLPAAIVTLWLADGLTPATDANGNPVTSQITPEDGRYLFTHLLPGDYVIRVTPPVGYLLTLGSADPDNNDNNDSNGLPGIAVQSLPITLTSGDEPVDDEDTRAESNLSVDFGFYLPVTVGNRVWYDNNGDGFQDMRQDDPLAEQGVPGVVVMLYNAATDQAALVNGNLVLDTTDSAGFYLFEQLPPGAYYVVFNLDTLPSGYLVTIPHAVGLAETDDSDADLTTGQTRATNFLSSGSKDLDLDLGIYRTASIGNYAWFDIDKDGLKGDDEPGVVGISVNLYNVQGDRVAMTLTDHDGYFQFAGLTPGDYYLEFIAPPNYTFTLPDVDGEFNSDADPSNGRTVLTTLVPGENDLSWGAGFVSPTTAEDQTEEPLQVNNLYLPWINQ